MKKFLFLLVLLCLNFPQVLTASPLSGPTSSISDTERDTRRGLCIYSDPVQAEVYINKKYTGTTPLFLATIRPGRYKIDVIKEGYAATSQWVEYSGETIFVDFVLTPLSGRLVVHTDPQDAQVFLNNQALAAGLNTVYAGTYTLTVERFGYITQTEKITIESGVTLKRSYALVKAPFTLENFQLDREVFNAGRQRPLKISFEISGPAVIALWILNQQGEAVFQENLPQPQQAHQEWFYDGRGYDRQLLPDGQYTARLVVQPDPAGPLYQPRADFRIDSHFHADGQIQYSGGPGLALVGLPEVLPPGYFQISALLLANLSTKGNIELPALINFRWGIGYSMESGVSAALFLGNTLDLPLLFSAYYRWQFFDRTGSWYLQSALDIKLSFQYQMDGDPFTNFSGLHVGNTWSLGSGPFLVVVEPQFLLTPWRIKEDFDTSLNWTIYLYLRCGIRLDFTHLSVGVSAVFTSLPNLSGFTLPVTTALDLVFKPLAGFFSLSLHLVARWDRTSELGAGLGLSVLY